MLLSRNRERQLSSLNRQLVLDIDGPVSHHDRLHSAPHGTVLVWEMQKEEKRWTKIRPGDPAAAIIASFAGGTDTYISVNQFAHWRLISQLRSLRACYVDIDGCTDLEAGLEKLTEQRMPPPSFVVFSGRGMHFYWVLRPTPSKALPVWQAVQDSLIKALAGVGADRKARDCTRVLRLVGTTNSKNDAETRGRVLTGAEWSLHELADEVLGVREPKASRSASVHDLSAAGARKGSKVRPHTGSIYDWWYLVYRDLCAIVDHNWFGGVPEGQRDGVLFLMSCALSWFAHTDVLEAEICKTAENFMPTLSETEVQTQMKRVISRAHAAAAGETIEWGGQKVDPRYRFKAETMRTILGDLIHPDLHGQLRALAPPEVIQQRKKERGEARYGMRRDAYLDSAGQRMATARLMKAQGASIAEIQAQLGVSRASVFNYLKQAV